MTERDEFAVLAAEHQECKAVNDGGCACLGTCLGHHLAKLRCKYDANHTGPVWWSDQLHGWLLIRDGDSGRAGAALNADNYWTGAV